MKLFRLPEYTKIRVDLPAEVVDQLREVVAYVKTRGEWERENADISKVTEHLVNEFLETSQTATALAFREWKEKEKCERG